MELIPIAINSQYSSSILQSQHCSAPAISGLLVWTASRRLLEAEMLSALALGRGPVSDQTCRLGVVE